MGYNEGYNNGNVKGRKEGAKIELEKAIIKSKSGISYIGYMTQYLEERLAELENNPYKESEAYVREAICDMNASNCCDCNSEKVESCLCHKCIQKIINNANNLGRKEGAKDELEKIKNYCEKNSFHYWETNKEAWEYANKKLKELV